MALRFKKNKNRAKDVSEVRASSVKEPFRIVHLQKLVDVLLEYVLFLVVFFGVSFWYIDNRYVCEKKMLQITKLEKELQDRKFVWLTISADLTQLSRQSEVEKVIKEKNIELKVSSEPAIKIK